MKRHRPAASPLQQIIALGERLLQAPDLAARRDCLTETAAALLNGQVDLWLDERLAHLPGGGPAPVFPPRLPSPSMAQAFETGRRCISEEGHLVAVPLRYQTLLLGVLQVRRPPGQPWRKPELDLLDALAAHASLAFYASHRVAVEQWRLEQLSLVRQVSAQVANVLQLDELARRVTDLILHTFRYYFVAIFTLEPGQKVLHFRSSAGPLGRRRRRPARLGPIELGQGLIGSAAQSGEEIVVNDVRGEPRFRFITSLPETESEVVLPLKIGDQILGVLDIQSDQRDAFHPNDLLVLRALADNIAIAVNHAHLYSDLQKRLEQLAVVAEVGDDITSILDLDELLQRVAALIYERLGYPYVHLYTVHPNRRQIIFEAGSGARSQALKGYVISLDHGEGLIPWAARNAQTVLANDVSLEPRYRPSPFPPEDTRSELTVPLVYDNQVVGVLDLQSDQTNAFSESDLYLFEALANTIAVAIHNADLYRTERWRRQVADSLREVAGLISADASVDDVLDAILRELERNLPCDVAAVWLLEGDSLYLAHIHGADPLEVQAVAQRWPEAYEYLASTMRAETPVIRQPTDPFGPTGTAMGYAADYSSIAASLRVGDRLLGILTLSHHTAGRYGHEAQAITATFASYAAVAIENARLYDAAQEQAYASAALLQVAQTAVNANTLDEAIQAIVRILPILVGVRGCAIYLFTPQGYQTCHAYGLSPDLRFIVLEKEFEPGRFPLLDAVRAGAPMAVGLIEENPEPDCPGPELALTEEEILYALQAGDRLLIAIPLSLRAEVYGALLVEETAESRRFRNKRVEIIQGVAQQVALAIQNEHFQREMVLRERLEQEVQVARQIQETFLPDRLPEIPGWDLAASWRTAREVGGDFYDVFELPGGRLGLFIADVSDKGVPAALFMALTRTLVRAVVYDLPSPAEALRRVNALILPDNEQEMFVTAFYAVVDLQSGRLTYANAGHNPPLLRRAETTDLASLERTGAALGILPDLPLEDRSLEMQPGDCLLLYTDGLSEAFSPTGEQFGVERLLAHFQAHACDSPRQLLNLLEAAAETFMESPTPADDMTLLALKRLIQPPAGG
ncbi:MAG: GAF domain-containing protein [Anaerolineales bacterium]